MRTPINARRCIKVVVNGLSIIIASVAIVLTAVLQGWHDPEKPNAASPKCLIDGYSGWNGARVCGISYTFACVGIVMAVVATVCVVLAWCGTAHVPLIVDMLFQLFLAVWWLIAAITLTYYAVRANQRNWPRSGTRFLLLAANYVNFLLFFINVWTNCVCCCVRYKEDAITLYL